MTSIGFNENKVYKQNLWEWINNFKFGNEAIETKVIDNYRERSRR